MLNIIDGVKEAIKLVITRKHTPYLIGSPGIGKTEIITSLKEKPEYIFDDNMKRILENFVNKISNTNLKFDEIKIGVYSTELHTVPEEYLSGLPKYSENKEYTQWTKPEIIQVLEDLSKENNIVIWFVDDIHRANKTKQDYFFELESHRSIHGFKLPDNVFIIAAGNDTVEAGRVKMLTPIVSRLTFIHVTSDVEHWVKSYAVDNNVHPMVVAFLLCSPKYFITKESQEPYCTPRTWVKASEYLYITEEFENKQITDLINDKEKMFIITNVLMGILSKQAVSEFIKFIVVSSKVDIDSIISDPSKLKDINSKSEEFIILHFLSIQVADNLVKYITNKDEAKYKETVKLILDIMSQLKEKESVFSNIFTEIFLKKIRSNVDLSTKDNKVKSIIYRDLLKISRSFDRI